MDVPRVVRWTGVELTGRNPQDCVECRESRRNNEMFMMGFATAQPAYSLCQASFLAYICVMTTVEDIEKAIAKLAPAELDRLRDWFEDFQAARFDEKIERDAKAGKLDRLAEQAVAEHRKGRSREL
jgi:hypothetical protein